MKTYLSWRDVLDCDSKLLHLGAAIEIANQLGYKAILWGKFVWWQAVIPGEWIKSDKTIEDIK